MRISLYVLLLLLTVVSCKREQLSDVVDVESVDTILIAGNTWRITRITSAGYYNSQLHENDIADFYSDQIVNINNEKTNAVFEDKYKIKSDSVYFEKLGSRDGKWGLGIGYYGWKITKLDKLDFWISRDFKDGSDEYNYEIRFRVK